MMNISEKIDKNLSLNEKKILQQEIQMAFKNALTSNDSHIIFELLLESTGWLDKRAAQGSIVYSAIKNGIISIAKSEKANVIITLISNSSDAIKNQIVSVLEKFSCISSPLYIEIIKEFGTKKINHSTVEDCQRILKINEKLKKIGTLKSNDEVYRFLTISYTLGINGAKIDVDEAYRCYKSIANLSVLSADKELNDCLNIIYYKRLEKNYSNESVEHLFNSYKLLSMIKDDNANKLKTHIYKIFKNWLDKINENSQLNFDDSPIADGFVSYIAYCELITVVLHHSYIIDNETFYVGSLLDHLNFKEARYLFDTCNIIPKLDDITAKYHRIDFGNYKRIPIYPYTNEYKRSAKNFFLDKFGKGYITSTNVTVGSMGELSEREAAALIFSPEEVMLGIAPYNNFWFYYFSIESNYLYYTKCLPHYLKEDDIFIENIIKKASSDKKTNYLKIIFIGSGDLREVAFAAKYAKKLGIILDIYVIDQIVWPINFFSLNNFEFNFTNINTFTIFTGNFFEILNSNEELLNNSNNLILYFSRVINFVEKINNYSASKMNNDEYFINLLQILDKYKRSQFCIVSTDKVGKESSKVYHDFLKDLIFECANVNVINGYEKSNAYIFTSPNIEKINFREKIKSLDNYKCEPRIATRYVKEGFNEKILKSTIDEIKKDSSYILLIENLK